MHFATCDRSRALEFLKKLYPSKEITDTEGCAMEFLNYVERDIVRVQDPMMHGMACQVIPSTNWDDSLADKIKEAIGKFHNEGDGMGITINEIIDLMNELGLAIRYWNECQPHLVPENFISKFNELNNLLGTKIIATIKDNHEHND